MPERWYYANSGFGSVVELLEGRGVALAMRAIVDDRVQRLLTLGWTQE